MYLLIQYASRLEVTKAYYKNISIIDRIQNILLSLIKSEFFPWVCLIFILNKKNWKRPVIMILILHLLFRSVGDGLREIMELIPVPKDVKTLWPNTNTRWLVGNAIAHVFWLGGEMVGDWYLYIRTKAVTNNKMKVNIVYICCIAYNIAKFIGIVSYFIYLPIDFNQVDSNGKQQNGILLFDITWWTIVAFYHIVGFLYDTSVLYALTTDLFTKLKEFKDFSENTFMDKFKQISELLTFVDPDPIRQVPLSIYYNLIYIDQILLKCFIQRDKMKNVVTSNNNVIKSKSSSSFNINNTNQSYNSYRKLNHQYIDNKNPVTDNKLSKSKSRELNNQYSGNDTVILINNDNNNSK